MNSSEHYLLQVRNCLHKGLYRELRASKTRASIKFKGFDADGNGRVLWGRWKSSLLDKLVSWAAVCGRVKQVDLGCSYEERTPVNFSMQ